MPILRASTDRPDGKRVERVTIQAQRGPQMGFLNCNDRYVAFFSGFGGGKTWAGASKAALNTLVRFRGYDGLVVAPTFGDLQTFVVPEILTRFEEMGIAAHHKASSPQFIWLWQRVDGKPKKIKLHLRSGSHPESIAGFQVAWCWIDEACRIPANINPTKDVKTQCTARMRGVGLRNAQMFITSTHEGELTWPNLDWCDPDKRKPHHTFFRGSTFDNRYMVDYANGLIEQYDKKLVKQYVYGEAVTIAGVLIYYSFLDEPWPGGNVDGSIKLDPLKPVALSLDFNAAPGMHAVVGQYHMELDEFWVVDEIHRDGMNIPHLVHEYAKRYKEQRIVTQVYGDPSGHSRDTSIGETSYAWVARAMQDHQLAFVDMSAKSAPLREDRYISVNAALESGNGKRHLRVHPRCKRLIRDLNSVHRDELGRVDKTQEKTGFVHLSDALGYWVHDVRPVNRYSVSNFSARAG